MGLFTKSVPKTFMERITSGLNGDFRPNKEVFSPAVTIETTTKVVVGLAALIAVGAKVTDQGSSAMIGHAVEKTSPKR